MPVASSLMLNEMQSHQDHVCHPFLCLFPLCLHLPIPLQTQSPEHNPTALVGPRSQFWSPIRRVDVERLEKVQARATKLVPSIRHKGYQRRLADLGLFTLEQRRLRGLLIETFKILRGFSGLDPASVFELSVNRTRNHGYKVVPPRFNTVLYRDFPTVRVCNLWNSLPEAVVNAPSVDAFKGRLDKILLGLAF